MNNCNKRHHTHLLESSKNTTQTKQNIADNNFNNNNLGVTILCVAWHMIRREVDTKLE